MIFATTMSMLQVNQAGVPVMWHKIYKERSSARRKMFPENEIDDTPASKMAQAMLYFDENADPEADNSDMAFDDRNVCSEVEILATSKRHLFKWR